MTIELSSFLTQLMNMVPEADTELVAIIRNQIIKGAVMDYGRDRPDTASGDITGDGGKYYPINTTNLTAWADGFSRIQSIQLPSPTVASDETPVYLNDEDWDEDYYAGGVRYLWFPSHAPAGTETFRVTYSAPYQWTAASTTTNVNQATHGFSLNDYVYLNNSSVWVDAATGTNTGQLLATHQVTTVTDVDNIIVTILGAPIPEIDFFAVCNLAACHVCQAIAERFSRTSDSTITADSVNHVSRAGEFANRAREFCRLYGEHIGIVSGDANGGGTTHAPIAEFIDLDPTPTVFGERDYLFHRKGSR